MRATPESRSLNEYTKFIMADGSGKRRYENMKTRWARIELL